MLTRASLVLMVAGVHSTSYAQHSAHRKRLFRFRFFNAEKMSAGTSAPTWGLGTLAYVLVPSPDHFEPLTRRHISQRRITSNDQFVLCIHQAQDFVKSVNAVAFHCRRAAWSRSAACISLGFVGKTWRAFPRGELCRRPLIVYKPEHVWPNIK